MNRVKDTSFSTKQSVNLGGKLCSLHRPIVMGILNISKDSFYDGGKYASDEERLNTCRRMLSEGAEIIDIGAMSTRPGATEISAAEEIEILSPVLEMLIKEIPAIKISVDTYRTAVAEEAAKKGAVIINDISGGTFDKNMPAFIADSQLAYILMHIQGRPRTMQQSPAYTDVVIEVMQFFGKQLDAFFSRGATDIILDPGFGFGKTLEHNYQLLNRLHAFQSLGLPILVGISRKSMINQLLHTTPETALNGTTAAHMLALMQGASILRAHDVKPATEAIRIFEAFKGKHQNPYG